MSPFVVIATLGGLGAWLLFGSKKPATSQTSVTVPAAPSVVPTVVTTPIGNATVTPPTATTPGSVTLTPVGTPEPPNVIVATNRSPDLTYEETVSLESDLPSDLYRKAMASQHPVYVAAAAARLAGMGDTRAMDLTLRVANWGN